MKKMIATLLALLLALTALSVFAEDEAYVPETDDLMNVADLAGFVLEIQDDRILIKTPDGLYAEALLNDKTRFEGLDGVTAATPLHHMVMPALPEESILDMLIPNYITSLIYGALLESCASENGARMQAMDSATSNAEEMIEDLTLLYNRARQGSITQELTEIIAGASAIS